MMSEDPPMMDLAALVRTRDYDRFLAIQLAPRHRRPGLYAVTAFASELAQIDARMSDALLATIRFVWWREALEEVAAGHVPRRHPTVLALAEVYREAPVVFTALFPMLDAYAAAEGVSHSLVAAWLYRAWAFVLGVIVDEPLKARISAETELCEWAGFIARRGFGDLYSTVSFRDFLTNTPDFVNESLAFINEEIGDEAWKAAALGEIKMRLEATRKPWPGGLKLLGVPSVIARFYFAQMMRRSDSGSLLEISETSPRKILAVLRYGLTG